MASTPYVHERQLEHWTSQAIVRFFTDAGYKCTVFPIPQHAEFSIPVDHIFQPTSTLKLFGLQYKALYSGKNDHWRLESFQHERLQQFSWFYYGLSDLVDIRDYQNALHALRIKETGFPFVGKLNQSNTIPYRRWWSFYRELERCGVGAKVSGVAEFVELFLPALTDLVGVRQVEQAVDIFVIDPDDRQLLHMSRAS